MLLLAWLACCHELRPEATPLLHAGAEAARKLAHLGEVRHMPLDLGSRDSIRRFAERVADRHGGAIATLVRGRSAAGEPCGCPAQHAPAAASRRSRPLLANR
jgi:NAD(P)-dependent dehydrogenase (short-subunit alcohol dehydrogenase family)